MKIIKICGIVFAALLLLIIAVPIALKGKIKDIVVAQGNEMLNAGFSIETLNLTLIRNFPNATVTIKGLDVWGADDFARDTLLSAARISATVNLRSLFGKSGFDITRIEVVDADVKAMVLEDGRPNWDIMKPSENTSTEDTVKSESDFKILLKKVTLQNVNISYIDKASKMDASLEGLQLTLSGDMSAERTILRLKSAVEKAGIRYGGIPYLTGAKVGLKSDIDADLKQMKFTLEKNTLSINAISAGIDGMVAMSGDAIDMDLTLNTEKVGFKELLSMIPAIYAKEFSSLQATGNVAFNAWVKGRMEGDLLPAFEARIDVSDGSFRYPSLPKGVDNISIAASASNTGGTADKTEINVNPLKFTMAGNPFSAALHLSTPISDPAFNISAQGVLDLGMIREVYPLDDITLNGLLNADFNISGRMSYVEKALYDRFTASGSLTVSDMQVKMADMPDLKIDKSIFSFEPKYLTLSETSVKIGSSDITADCSLENYIAFALKGETLKGNLNLRSNLLDLNEIMGITAAPEEQPKEESSMAAPVIPKNIHFDMNTSIGNVLFDNLKLQNVAGKVSLNDGRLDMSNLSFNTLGGGVTANGYYSNAEGASIPELNAAFALNDVSFSQTFHTFITIQKLAPIFENLKGNFSGNIAINTKLDSLMNPLFNTMNGAGELKTQNLNLSGIKVIDMIADATKQEKLKSVDVKDVAIQFTVKEGRVNTKPFDLKLGESNLNLSGSTGIDQTIDYSGKISLPASTGIGKYTTVDLKIGGSFASPSVSLDTKSMVSQALETIASDALKDVGSKLGVDLSDVEKQRDKLIEQAKAEGEKLVAEAQKQSDKLVEQAGSNPVKKLAAQTAGKKLVDEATKQAEKLVKKAAEQGTADSAN